ncbi:Acyl carrier protein [compost metagenome]
MAETFDATGVDELDRIEMVLALEEEFEMEIPDYQVDHFKSFADMHNYVKDNYRGC